MKTQKKKKWFTATLAIAALSVLTAGFAIGAPVTASAEDPQPSNYWHFSKGSGTAVSVSTASTVDHTFTPAIEGSDVSVMFNGEVSPVFSGDAGKMLFTQDTGNGANSPADAIVYTYTATTDYDKQLSIIYTYRSGKFYATVAFTDDITIKNG